MPLIAIYLMEQGGVTMGNLAAIASVSALVSMLMEIPAGYIADRIGHRKTLILGSAISALSVLLYIAMPNFYGGMAASALFFAGFSFTSGTMQAFMHETLLALGRDHEYSRVMGLAQSYGLLGNVVLVALVPMTYSINPVIPFVLGFLCLFVNCVVAWSFVNPPERVWIAEARNIRHIFDSLCALKKKINLALLAVVFVMFGVASASYHNAILLREVMLKDIGIPVIYFGVLLAIGSLAAAIVGRYIHFLEKLKPGVFYALDGLYLCIAYVLVGVSASPVVIIFAFMLFMAYDRTRSIIFEAQILREFPYSQYKSTVISTLHFSTLINALWVPVFLSFLAQQTSLGTGYALYGVMIGVVLGLMLAVYAILHRQSRL